MSGQSRLVADDVTLTLMVQESFLPYAFVFYHHRHHQTAPHQKMRKICCHQAHHQMD